MELNNEELTKKEEELKKEVIREYMKSSSEMIKKRNRKIIIISLLVILIIIIIKIFFGTIELYNIFGYSSSNARYYKVTVNNKQVAVSYISTHKVPIIPFLVNFNSVYLGNSHIVGNDDVSFQADSSKIYITGISSYSCYHEDIQTECKNNQQEMKENKDEKYSLLTITRITNPREVVYQGNLVEDISPFITKKGEYHIEITAKHGLVETKMHFYLEKEN